MKVQPWQVEYINYILSVNIRTSECFKIRDEIIILELINEYYNNILKSDSSKEICKKVIEDKQDIKTYQGLWGDVGALQGPSWSPKMLNAI